MTSNWFRIQTVVGLEMANLIQRQKHVFNVEVKDPGAPVDFYINGKKVSKSDERCEYVNLGEGKHQLIIHHVKMDDLGTIEAKTPSNRYIELYYHDPLNS